MTRSRNLKRKRNVAKEKLHALIRRTTDGVMLPAAGWRRANLGESRGTKRSNFKFKSCVFLFSLFLKFRQSGSSRLKLSAMEISEGRLFLEEIVPPLRNTLISDRKDMIFKYINRTQYNSDKYDN